MAKAAKAERINWKAAYGEMHQKYCNACDGRILAEGERDAANVQIKHMAAQLAETGRDRDDAFKTIGLAKATLKGAASVVKAHNADLAAALYAQADAL
jgi:hypothetical protein